MIPPPPWRTPPNRPGAGSESQQAGSPAYNDSQHKGVAPETNVTDVGCRGLSAHEVAARAVPNTAHPIANRIILMTGNSYWLSGAELQQLAVPTIGVPVDNLRNGEVRSTSFLVVGLWHTTHQTGLPRAWTLRRNAGFSGWVVLLREALSNDGKMTATFRAQETTQAAEREKPRPESKAGEIRSTVLSVRRRLCCPS